MTVRIVLKWLWAASVFGFAVFYGINHREKIGAAIDSLPSLVLVGAALLIIAAKLMLAENMRLAMTKARFPLSCFDSFCVYNLTQLGKYIPGSIWQFVGRIAVLKERGAPLNAIRDSMIAEQVWVLLTSLLFSIPLMMSAQVQQAIELLLQQRINFTYLVAAVVVAGIISIGVALAMLPQRLLEWAYEMRPSIRALLNLSLTWASLGTAFWITLGPHSDLQLPWLYFVSLYCAAYLAGFLVPFAPAGLGVREAVLVFGAAEFVGIELAIILAGINRIIYFTVEILVSVPCLIGPARYHREESSG